MSADRRTQDIKELLSEISQEVGKQRSRARVDYWPNSLTG